MVKGIIQMHSIDFVCTIEKDRTRLIQSQRYIFTPGPDEEKNALAVEGVFRPILDWHLKQEGHSPMQHVGSTDALMTPDGDDFKWRDEDRRRKIALDEAKETIMKYFPSATNPQQRRAKIAVCENAYGHKSWEAISDRKTVTLEALENSITSTPDGPSQLEQECIKQSEILEAETAKPTNGKAKKGAGKA